MKKIIVTMIALLSAGYALPASANDIMVASTMQRCTTNEECALVTNSCQDNCGFVPVNRENLTALQGQYQTRCGKPMEANPTCKMNPPISAACVNSRCTIDYAYANNADAKDYQAGAYGVPPAAVPSKVQGDYTKVDDTKGGFTAYNLPQGQVKADTVGTLHTTIYVPPSAPVSGGNYVPVGAAPVAAPTAPAAPIAPPAIATPTNATQSTPPVVVPGAAPALAAPVPTPPPEPVVAPTYVPPATPSNVPVMTPSAPNQLPPETAAPAVPATPYQYVAPENVVTAPQPPAPTPVPVAPPGSKPIPPSDLMAAPSSVPAPGNTIPVNPEDPGAPPPAGTKIMLKGSEMETDATKSFGATTTTKKTIKTYELN